LKIKNLMKIAKLKIENSERAFTVLETIIAIAVVSLAIAGATTAVRIGLVGASIAKDQVKAFYLAQEAVEIVRNKRDANILASYNGTPTNWLAGIAQASDPCDMNVADKTCTVDATGPGGVFLTSCGGGWNSCPYLRQNSSTYLYGYDGSWNQAPFKREIQIENISANEVSITVQVSWAHGAVLKSFKTKTTLMNWF
jgi:type II secretory pathway pseudopilin PulG